MEPDPPPDPFAFSTPLDAAADLGVGPSDASEPGVLGWARPQERLDRRVVVYWLITGSIGWFVLAGIATVLIVVFQEVLLGDWLAFVVTGATLLGLLLLWTLISPSLAYSRWRFAIDDEMLRMQYGILYHEEKAIPVSRLQHVDLTRGPIERMFGLATLVVYTAGNEAASFRLSGLSVGRAEDLRDQILAARGDDVI